VNDVTAKEPNCNQNRELKIGEWAPETAPWRFQARGEERHGVRIWGICGLVVEAVECLNHGDEVEEREV
jgi:hypothetical protein